jgi:hypothetical protein
MFASLYIQVRLHRARLCVHQASGRTVAEARRAKTACMGNELESCVVGRPHQVTSPHPTIPLAPFGSAKYVRQPLQVNYDNNNNERDVGSCVYQTKQSCLGS